ncbi:hypothetical protein ACTI_11100 [Actinoplanes sp. OR16]|uniref:hypothetical protein n=1 Tax=Actinoplanes sp. OR16 TaxID=946334 RepID=UPI000F6EF4BE|nr:hypothetical protein [Actinoplanes sp. OR16]BBH64425.1 hypothetical protein ACTI_11100 [Actinoplanes sp. OR16]
MEPRSTPRGLIARSSLAAALFAVAVLPGWTLGDLVEQQTGRPELDWLITCGWSGLAVTAGAPWGSYRRRDGWMGAVPLYGWYLLGVLSWRLAMLPYRDWEPRRDELWKARWLTGDLVGYWRADPPASRAITAARRPAAARRTR